MLEKAKKILKDKFNFNSFRLAQENIIDSILNKKNTLGIMPTGGGKSICFQIPSVLFSQENSGGVTIVISPLISLMKDQVKSAREFGIKASFLNSFSNASDKKKLWADLYKGEVELLFISPERAINLLTYIYNENIKVNLYAIDEAHCIVQWGHDFREDYQKVCSIIVEHVDNYKNERNEIVPILGLTATADSKTRTEIARQLEIENKNIFISSFYRPNISLFVETKYGNGLHQLKDFLDKNKDKSGIIYCNTKKEAENVGRKFGLHVYHADQDIDYRIQVQNAFIANTEKVIVATTAFGMGIDKPNIDFVFHTSIPYSLEDWYQQFGRAGRDGRKAIGHVLYSPKDAIKIQARYQVLENNSGYDSLNAVIDILTKSDCLWERLLNYFGENLKKCNNCSKCLNEEYKIEIDTKEISLDIQNIIKNNKLNVSEITKILIGSRALPIQLRTLKEYGKYKNKFIYKNKKVNIAFKEQIISNLIATLGLNDKIKKEIEPTEYNKFAFTYYLDDSPEEFEIHIEDYSNYLKVKELKKENISNRQISKLDTSFLNKKDNNTGTTVSSKAFYTNKKKQENKFNYNIKENINTTNLDFDYDLYLKIKEGRTNYAGNKKKYTKAKKNKMYLIMSEKIMEDISKIKPTTMEELYKVPGFGEKRSKRHGKWVLKIVNDYLLETNA